MSLLIGDLLSDAAAVNPTGVAATLDAHQITYRDLDASASRVANVLEGHGVGPGQVIAWWSPASLASIAGFAAAARLGAVFAPINPALSADEVAGTLEYLEPRLLVSGAALADTAVGVWDGPGLEMESLETLSLHASPALRPRPIDDSATHVVYMTSGTTGKPKGVEVSHRASWLRAFPGGSTFASWLRGDGGILPSFPLFHYGGWHYVLEAWHHRCAFHLCSRFDGESLVASARRRRPSAMYCIPAVWERVLEAAPPSGALDSVRHADTGTSAAPADLLRRLRERMPAATTSVLYGSSEGGHHSTLHDRDVESHPGSVGRVAPPGVIRIAGDGEILYRGPTVMNGYYRLPDQTSAALAGGWYHTGDLGLLDETGYLYITGRLREVIRTGGETVAPSEVEALLRAYPGIADLAVVGVPDQRWGELVVAAVVPVPGRPVPSVEDLREHIGTRLASYKHPRAVVELAAVTRTAATGQVQRTLVRDEAVTLLEKRAPR